MTTVLYNSAALLPRYVHALAPGVREGWLSVTAVDNASPDDSTAVLEELLPDARILRSETNGGFAAGCNRAWPLVQTPYWLLLNPDVQAGGEEIKRLVEWMEGHPDVGAASPGLRDEGGRCLPVARPHDSLWRPLVEALRLHKLVPEPFRSRWLLSGRAHTPETIRGWVPGAALIVRKAAVDQAGLLDEDIFMYGEDREWCWRIARAGWKIGVCSSVEFVHAGGASAAATWGEEERVRREVAGHLRVARAMHGRNWANALRLMIGLLLWAESRDLRRAPEIRRDSALRSRLYLQVRP